MAISKVDRRTSARNNTPGTSTRKRKQSEKSLEQSAVPVTEVDMSAPRPATLAPELGTWSRMGIHDVALAYAAHFEGDSMGTFILHKFGLRESAGWERLVKQHQAEVASAEAEGDPDPDYVNDPLAEAVTRGFVAGLYAARWEAGRKNKHGELLLDAVDGDMTPVGKDGE